MKINSGEARIFVGGLFDQQQKGAKGQQGILPFANREMTTQEKVAQKKTEARDKAMELIKNVYAADKKIDDDLAERAQRIDDSKQKILDAMSGMREIDAHKKALKEQYGITDDCEEQQELKLLEKRRDSMKIGSNIQLTDEEKEKLAQIDERGMTEYQMASLEADAAAEPYLAELEEAKKTILEEQVIMREMSLKRLESSPMVGAMKQAEEIMEAANKEIIGMLRDEAKQNVDEKMAETKEEMDKAKEEQEKEEERIEEIQEKAREFEEAVQERRDENKEAKLPDVPMDIILELEDIKNDVQQEVGNMLSDMKLLVEDLKGSVVDQSL